jgi:hypothetical protein
VQRDGKGNLNSQSDDKLPEDQPVLKKCSTNPKADVFLAPSAPFCSYKEMIKISNNIIQSGIGLEN